MNGIWNIIVAMTTVGYGDYYPKSHLGRFILIIAVILGTVIISLTVVALNGIINFDENEIQAYEILKRVTYRKELNDACQKIIYYNFKIKEMKRSIDPKDLNESGQYAQFVRNLKKITTYKYFLSKKMKEFSLNRDKDKFVQLEENISKCIDEINANFEFLRDFRRKIKSQNKNQLILISNISTSLKISRD